MGHAAGLRVSSAYVPRPIATRVQRGPKNSQMLKDCFAPVGDIGNIESYSDPNSQSASNLYLPIADIVLAEQTQILLFRTRMF